MEHKTDMNINKTEKYKKKMIGGSMMGHKTNMNIIEICKYKNPSNTFMTELKTEYNYTLVNQTINIYKSNKGATNLKTTHKKG